MSQYKGFSYVLGSLSVWVSYYETSYTYGLNSTLRTLKESSENWAVSVGYSLSDISKESCYIEGITNVDDFHRALCGQVADMLEEEATAWAPTKQQVLRLAGLVAFAVAEGVCDDEYLI